MKPFEFKLFTVHQDRCAMKIGTDGVLLGAWTSLEHKPTSILDIGSGTGVIALMLAQRSNAETIDAIELDENAYEQCVENFETSPWSDRLFCYHASFQEFYEEMDEEYDLIVSNPPFFPESVSSGNIQRDTSRQNASLPFEELLNGVSRTLSPEGIFSIILPNSEEKQFIQRAKKHGLFIHKITRVRGTPSSKIKRSLMQFGRSSKNATVDELIVETARHQYTKEYIKLTGDFYLKM